MIGDSDEIEDTELDEPVEDEELDDDLDEMAQGYRDPRLPVGR